MKGELLHIRAGLILVLLGLAFGVGMGISFGVNEDIYKDYISSQVEAHPDLHDEASANKIWRYAQRAHFHATGIAAFSLGLLFLLMFSDMRSRLKSISAVLIGLGSLYSLSWLSMFSLAPSIGREAAHHHFLTEILAYLGVGGLVIGALLLAANLFFGLLAE